MIRASFSTGPSLNRRRFFLICLWAAFSLLLSSVAFGQSVKTGQFTFEQWDGPPLTIFYAEPEGLTADAPIVIVMHGASRNADDYRDNWVKLAQQYGLRVYAPEFDKKRFPKSRDYNSGGLTKDKDKAFEAIEPLFDTVKARRPSDQEGYYIFGHSAGGQFVHRYVFFGKHERLKLALAANSGWYTLPTQTANWPYGLGKLKKSRYDIDALLKSPLTILLGNQDINPKSYNLRQTPEAKAQGNNRYDRGIYFLKTANAIAKQRGVKSAWGFHIVPDVAHDNAGMAIAAAAVIDTHAKEK